MKAQYQSDRKVRVRQFIQAGDLLQNSGLLQVFNIALCDDLQTYENREQASTLLGFLIMCFEKHNIALRKTILKSGRLWEGDCRLKKLILAGYFILFK